MEPYGETAWTYRGAGWVGVLPLPPGAKWPPPSGFTGWAGLWPSGADVQAWVDGPQSAGNIALRLPAGVYGLDVDDYDGKTGAAALSSLVERLGPLPPTWTVSSREASASGIRLYRASLEPGRHWRDEPGGHGAGIEAVHLGHRYAVVWPSTHPETGRKYVWRRPDGLPADDGEVPRLDALPDLPAGWIEALSEPGEPRVGEVAGHDETIERVAGWRDGEACARVRLAFERAMGGLGAGAAGAALHPALVTGVHELCNLGHEGHAGVRRALADHHDAFVRVRHDRGTDRGDSEARAEWWRAVRGAIGKLPAGSARGTCDCDTRSGAGVTFDAEELGWTPAAVAATTTASGSPEYHPDVMLEIWRREVRRQADAIEHARAWRPPVQVGTLADWLAEPDDPARWRIHGLLGVGHNAILVAPRKAGKTTVINNLIKAYADDGRFLGAQEIYPTGRNVAIFNYEIDERQYKRWLRDVGISRADRVRVLNLRGRSLALAGPQVRAWVTAWLSDNNVGMWVLDPYSRAYIGSLDNGNNEAEVSRFLDLLDVVKADARVDELVMPVHTPKARAEEGQETSIGSQRLEGWPDVMWWLTRDGRARFFRAEGRDIDHDETELTWDERSRSLRIEVIGRDRKTTREMARLDRLVAFIHANPECTVNDIRDGLGISSSVLGDLIRADGGARIAVEHGPNRSKIHILKSDITGGTEKMNPTTAPLDPTTAGVVGGITTRRGNHTTTEPVGGVANPTPTYPLPAGRPVNPFTDLGVDGL